MSKNNVKIDREGLNLIIHQKGIKKTWLAKKLGVSLKTITRWTNGSVEYTSFKMLLDLSETLGVSPELVSVDFNKTSVANKKALKEVASKIINDNLLLVISTSSNWSLFESIVRAALVESHIPKEKGKILNWLSIAYWRQKQYTLSRRYANEALSLGKKEGEKAIVLKAMFNLGTVASLEENFQEALNLLLECEKMVQDFDDLADAGALFTNLSMAYKDVGQFDESLKYQLKAVHIFNDLNKTYNLSIAYHCLGNIYEALSQEKKAIAAYEKSLVLATQCAYAEGIQAVCEDLDRLKTCFSSGQD